MGGGNKSLVLYHLTEIQCCKFIAKAISLYCIVYGIYLWVNYSIVLRKLTETEKRLKRLLLFAVAKGVLSSATSGGKCWIKKSFD